MNKKMHLKWKYNQNRPGSEETSYAVHVYAATYSLRREFFVLHILPHQGYRCQTILEVS